MLAGGNGEPAREPAGGPAGEPKAEPNGTDSINEVSFNFNF